MGRVWRKLRGFTRAEVPTEPVVVTVEDARFGTFTVTGHWHPRSIEVTGPWAGRLTLGERSPASRSAARQIPPPRFLAPRRDAVVLAVDGQQAPLDCGRRALRRATYHVRATVAERSYLLRHTGNRAARLERDGGMVLTLEQPRDDSPFTMDPQGSADMVDASVAVALASAFGAGSPGFFRRWVRSVF